VLGIVLLIAAAWAEGFLLHDSSQAASISQALRHFRATEHTSGGLSGVYLYATKGRESVDALGGTSHTYPAKTSITVTEVPCGIQLRWTALEKRSTNWVFCSTAAGTELRSSDERHAFFGLSDHTVYLCSGRLLLPKSPVVGSTKSFTCRSSGNIEVGKARVLGRGTIDLGGSRVGAIRVRTDLRIRSGDSGSETIDWWLDSANALPLRIELKSRTSRKMWVGRVRYRENLSLRLLSLKPMR
jgi:hypothetical protein